MVFRCPICCREVVREQPDFPFCSERCRLIDLGCWASGDYAVPGEPVLDASDPPHDV